MHPEDVTATAIAAAFNALEDLDPEGRNYLEPRHVAAMLAAGVDSTNAEIIAEQTATVVAQREHAEIAGRAILEQTDMLRQIMDKVMRAGDGPTEYEIWRDALLIAATWGYVGVTQVDPEPEYKDDVVGGVIDNLADLIGLAEGIELTLRRRMARAAATGVKP